jgi:hypothetical protein
MLSYDPLREYGRYVQKKLLDEVAQDRLADLARPDNSTRSAGRWFVTHLLALTGHGPERANAVDKPLVNFDVRL